MTEAESVVREHLDAAPRRAALDSFDEGVVLVVDAGLTTGTFRGREAVGRWFADWFTSFSDDYRFEVEEMRSVGEHVFLVARHRGRGRASGVQLDWSVPYTYTVRAGKIVRVEIFEDRADALKAVRLEG
jgi:ketosteroid isomerase-like protein